MSTTPKPISQMLEKTTLVDNDLFEIVDSEETNLSLKNKKVKKSTLQSQIASHNYGVIYVDLADGNDANNGLEATPVKTLQKAVDIYESNGGDEIFIQKIGFTEAAQVVVSNTVGTLIIRGMGRDYEGTITGDQTKIQNIQINDKDVVFKNVTVGTCDIVQTGTNTVNAQFNNCNIVTITETIATPGNATIRICDNSKFTPSGTINTPITLTFGSFMLIGLATTLADVSINEECSIVAALPFASTITTLTANRGTISLVSGSTLNVVTFNYNATVFENKAAIVVSGTTTGVLGTF